MITLSYIKRWRQPWVIAVALVVLIPFVPDYVAMLLAPLSLFFACRDAHPAGRSVTIGPLGKILMVYLLYSAIGILYSGDKLITFSTWGMWFVLLMAYVSLHTVLITRRRLDWTLLGISAVAGVIGFIACVQYAMRVLFDFSGHLQLWYPLDHFLYQISPMPINLEVVGDRACSTFSNPNIMAEYLVMVIPFITLYAFGGRSSRSRLFSRACLLLAVAGVWFSFSRGSYLALLAMAAIWTIANIQRISLMFLAAFSALSLMPGKVWARLLSINTVKESTADKVVEQIVVSGGDKAISERLQAWLVTWDSFLEHPLLGIGIGVGNTGAMLTAGGLKNVPHAHNIVLQLLAEGGIIALALVLCMGGQVVRTGIRLTRRRGQGARMGAAILAFAVGFCVIGMVDFPLFSPKLVGTFVTVMATVDGMGRLGRLERAVSPLLQVMSLSRFKFARRKDK